LVVYAPSRAAPRLESSKIFAKEFMVRHGLPTATPFEVVDDERGARRAAAAIGSVGAGGPGVVMKADGLAAGKGVLIVRSAADLDQAVRAFFVERRFGEAGARVLVEPFLEGEEISFMGLSDGRRVLALATSKDYKRIGDGDTGPNTGGMGAHSPSFVFSEEESERFRRELLEPTARGMAAEGHPVVGVIYAGLMLTASGPRVLEFNIRFGDPEAQVLLLRLEDDLAELLHRGATSGFAIDRLRFAPEVAACLVLANRGYPDQPATGDAIRGVDVAERRDRVHVFHAGTAERSGQLVAPGGRVLNVCATGATLASDIEWSSKILRRDIGRRALGEATPAPPAPPAAPRLAS
jgi:phosphoribosylamine--glycine ligase